MKLILQLIEKNEVKLLLPLQIKQEVERNRYSDWFTGRRDEINSKINGIENSIDDLKKKYSKYRSSNSLIIDLQREKNKLEKDKKGLEKIFTNKKSKPNQKLKIIFDKSVQIEENGDILRLAELRSKKRNPPRDVEGHYGDAIIWESLKSYFKAECTKKDDLFIVSNDKKAWGEDRLNFFLQEEWKNEIGSKVTLLQSVAEIMEKIDGQYSKDDQKKLIKEEARDLKETIISDFINSSSFINAGENAQKLLSIKDRLNKEDLERIIRASLSNHEIYRSIFTTAPLTALVKSGDLTVIAAAENIEKELWNSFCEKYHIDVIRVCDIPF